MMMDCNCSILHKLRICSAKDIKIMAFDEGAVAVDYGMMMRC